MLFSVSKRAMILEGLWTAAYKGNLEEVSSIVASHTVDVNAVADFDGRTALMQASRSGQTHVVAFLLSDEGGAMPSINHQNTVGESALSDAAENGSLATVSLLLSKGATVSDELLHKPSISAEIRGIIEGSNGVASSSVRLG